MEPDLKGMAEVVANHIPQKLRIVPLGNWKHAENDLYLEAFNGLLKDEPNKAGHRKYYGHAKGSSGYRSMVSRLKASILNMLYFLDLSKSRMSAALKAELECQKTGFQARTLNAFYIRAEGVEIANKTYQKAKKFGLANSILYNLAMMRKEASETGKYDELNRLSEETIYWLSRQAAETKAVFCFEKVQVHFAKSISQKPWLADKAFEMAGTVAKDLEQFDSPVLEYEHDRLMYAGHHLKKEYRKAISYMDRLEKYYEMHPDFAGDTRHAEIALYKLNCYMHLKDYAEGQKCVNYCMTSFWVGSSNRLFFMSLYFMFAMQAGEYAKALQIIREAENLPGFKKLDKLQRDKWKLYEVYYEYATNTRKRGEMFDYKKFIRSFTGFADDKSGYHASVYILAWCLHLRYGDPVSITGTSEALKKYRARYLGGIFNQRLNIFMNLMQAADQLDYHYDKIIQIAKPSLEKLTSTEQIEITGNLEGVEIIPLEKLWAMVTTDMKRF